MTSVQIHQNVDEIMSMYQQFGSEDYIGEPVSQIEHMCQCAQLAEASGADDELILAAFFHDIGHLYEFAFPEKKLQQMDGAGIVDHEKLGGEYLLSKGFSEKIAKLVQSHVAAKRYLTFKYPEYFDQLSPASIKTLGYQGGVMSAEEAAAFEADKLSDMYVQLRRWDEQAKEVAKPLPSLDHYKKLMLEHLQSGN
ncbi:MAG: phosphonate degradation HD-domain oxygenase [Ferruginibacter sp.]